jgi:iron complex outermembrane receptor protein
VSLKIPSGVAVCVLFANTAAADPSQADASDGETDVTVEGTRRPLAAARDDSISSSRVDGSRLRRAGSNASQVLAELPGTQLSRSGSGAELSTLSLRAASSAQTPVYLGQVRLNDDLTGTADLSRIPLWMLHRVEVYRGATPSEFNQWGVGGAVVFEPLRPRRSQLHASAGVGSFGARSFSAGAAVAGTSAASSFALRHARADNDFSYVDDGGTSFDRSDDRERTRTNAQHAETDVWSVSQWQLGRARFVTALNAFSRNQGAAGVALIPADRAHSRTRRLALGTQGSAPCTANAEACSIELSTDALWTTHAVEDPDRELGLGVVSTRLLGVRMGQSGAWRGRFGPVTARAGVRYELSQLESAAGSVRHANRFTGRTTLSLGYAPSRLLHALVATALDHHATQGASGPTGSDTMPQARLGAVLSPAEFFDLRGSVGLAQRPPTLGELYGVSAVSLGNPSLVPERGLSGELGARARHAESDRFIFEADLVGYLRRVDDLIAFRRSGFGALRPFNIGAAQILGAELSARADAMQHLLVDLSVTVMEPRDVSDDRLTQNDLLPFQSRLTSFARVATYAQPAHPEFSRVEVGTSLRTRASRVADPAGLVVLPASEVVSADVALSFFSDVLVLRGALDNVFDQRELDLLGFPLPGRSLHMRADLVIPIL